MMSAQSPERATPGPSNMSVKVKSPNGGKKRARKGVVSDEEEGDKKRRNRLALSCSECKRRKVACDRRIPCIACIKRNTPQNCKWDEAKLDPTPQHFALVTDVRQLAKRLAEVEQFLQTLPPELKAGAPKPKTLAVSGGVLDPLESDLAAPGQSAGDFTEGVEVMSDTEDAAAVLEAVAFGPQGSHGMDYQPPGALPYLDPASAAKSQATIAHSPGMKGKTELTAALTSILAPSYRLVNGGSSVQFGLDFGLSPDEVPDARLLALKRVYTVIPDPVVCRRLAAKYFGEVAWIHNTVSQRTFDAELDKYTEMHEQGRHHEVDPVWLALLCMILTHAVDGFQTDAPNQEERDPDRAAIWFVAAQRLLQLGDWQGTPQVRTIVVILLFGQWAQIVSVGYQANKFLSWLASAIRLAQILGLHQLGNNLEIMPPDDSFWPPGKNSIKREGALRLFSVLVFLDWSSATVRFQTYMLHPSQITTAALSNVNEEDLSATDWRINPLPRNVATDSSFEYAKYLVAVKTRMAFDKLVSRKSSTFSYETVLELDRNFREVLSELPDVWRSEHTKMENKSPRSRWFRNVCQETIHSRIVRLHRPFLSRGYEEDSRFAYSTKACVESAKIVVSSHHNILPQTANGWFIYVHNLCATIVLFCDLFHSIDSDLPEQELEVKKQTLSLAREIFSSHKNISSPHLRAVVLQGSRIINGLFMAEEKRRAARAARVLSPTAELPLESFAHVLLRISRELDLGEGTSHSEPLSGDERIDNVSTARETSQPNYDHLSAQIFSDIGMSSGLEGVTFWNDGNAASHLAAPGLGQDFGFLSESIDWAQVGLNNNTEDTTMGATTLLDQLWG